MMGKILFLFDESVVPTITSVTRCYDMVVLSTVINVLICIWSSFLPNKEQNFQSNA